MNPLPEIFRFTRESWGSQTLKDQVRAPGPHVGETLWKQRERNPRFDGEQLPFHWRSECKSELISSSEQPDRQGGGVLYAPLPFVETKVQRVRLRIQGHTAGSGRAGVLTQQSGHLTAGLNLHGGFKSVWFIIMLPDLQRCHVLFCVCVCDVM